MEKRYQVFVSSTFKDLEEERQEVMHALLELDCIPSGMELFPAANATQWNLIKKVIDDCDYYVLIIGGRYGSISPEGISYTEMEYRYAQSINKPAIAFLHRDPGKIIADKTEATPEGRGKLLAFRSVVEKKLCKHWDSPAELGSVVSRSLIQLIKAEPGVGWVRANEVRAARQLHQPGRHLARSGGDEDRAHSLNCSLSRERERAGVRVLAFAPVFARPEDGAPPSLMLEYQKSRRRRTALGLGDAVGVRCVQHHGLFGRQQARLDQAVLCYVATLLQLPTLHGEPP